VTFADPARLWLLLTVAAVGMAYLLLQLRRTRYALRFTNLHLLARLAPTRPSWRRHVPAGLFLIMLFLLVVGFARPQAPEQVPRERATVIVAVDISGSMAAEDVQPNRLEAASAAAVEFVDGLPPRFNVGVVAFAGTASVVVAPNADRTAVRTALQHLNERSIGRQGTAIGDAIAAALETIRTADPQAQSDPPPARIIILSDGANTAGQDPRLAATDAGESGVPVDSIAFGTPEGVISRGGRDTRVPVDGATLQGVADLTGGSYHQAGTAEELRQVYAQISSSVGYRTELREVSSRFIGYGLLVGLVVAAASLAWFSRLP
jgi:Ca-activated chloride channel family protein